jgi:phosphoribosylanthranilate isomerase
MQRMKAMVRVKVCGITSLENASMVLSNGVEILGFIFAPSKRRITPEKARAIISQLPPFVRTVGVFVNEEPADIKKIREYCGLDLVQLHGDEDPEMCRELMPFVIKAFRLKDASSVEKVDSFRDRVRAVLFDTYSNEKRGGTGKTFDWNLALKGKKFGLPVILSGGLGPHNIKDAISKVRPFAVDLNSGVEKSPGEKCPILIKELMEAITGEIPYD